MAGHLQPTCMLGEQGGDAPLFAADAKTIQWCTLVGAVSGLLCGLADIAFVSDLDRSGMGPGTCMLLALILLRKLATGAGFGFGGSSVVRWFVRVTRRPSFAPETRLARRILIAFVGIGLLIGFWDAARGFQRQSSFSSYVDLLLLSLVAMISAAAEWVGMGLAAGTIIWRLAGGRRVKKPASGGHSRRLASTTAPDSFSAMAKPSYFKRIVEVVVDWFNPSDVFISYGNLDGAHYIDALQQKFQARPGLLRQAQITIDYQRFDEGQPLPRATRRDIRRSTYVVVIVRPFAMASQCVHQEVGLAHQMGKIILVVNVDRWFDNPDEAERSITSELKKRPVPPSLYWGDESKWKARLHHFQQLLPDYFYLQIRDDPVPPERPSEIYDHEPGDRCCARLLYAIDRSDARRAQIRRVAGAVTAAGLLIGAFWLDGLAVARVSSLLANDQGFEVPQRVAAVKKSPFRPWLLWHLHRRAHAASESKAYGDKSITAEEYRSAVNQQALAGYLDWCSCYSSFPGVLVSFKRRNLQLLEASTDPLVRRDLLVWMAQHSAEDAHLQRTLGNLLGDASGSEPGLAQALVLIVAHRSAPSDELVQLLSSAYRTHPDPSVHAAIDWAFRNWKRADAVIEMDRKLAISANDPAFAEHVSEAARTRRWFVLDLDGRTSAHEKQGTQLPLTMTFALLPNQTSIAASVYEIPWGIWHHWMPEEPENARYLRIAKGADDPKIARLPVEDVSAVQIEKFCKVLGNAVGNNCFRLPSYDEWQDCAFRTRVPRVQTAYLWSPIVEQFEQLSNNFKPTPTHEWQGLELPSSVGEFMPNEIGLFDTIGNVHEIVRLPKHTAGYAGLAVNDLADDARDSGFLVPLDETANRSYVGFRLIIDISRVKAAQSVGVR
jgi:hypothetical protein